MPTNSDEIKTSGISQWLAKTPVAIGADQNDYGGTDDCTFARLSADAAWNITGLANGVDGRLLILINVGANAITVTHQDAASAVANRVITAGGSGQYMAQDAALVLIYDATTARWRQLSEALLPP